MNQGAVRHAILGVAGLALLAWVFGPALSTMGAAFLGIEYVDHYGTQWFYWLAQRSLSTGESPLHTDLFFYPWGKDIYSHTGANMLDAYLSVPFRLLLGPVLGYNVFLLVGLGLGGWAFYGLSREFTDDRLASAVGALLFALAPYALFEAAEGRPTQALLALPVVFVLWTWRTGTRRGWRAPLMAGVSLALCGYQYWYYAFFGGVVALVHGVWRALWPAPDAGGRLRTFSRHAVIALVAGGLVLPLALPLALVTHGGDVPGLLDVAAWTLSATPPVTTDGARVGLLLWQPLAGGTGFFVQDPTGPRVFLDRVVWTPLVLPVLGLLALWRPGRLRRGPWLAMMLAVALIAAGPVILVGRVGAPNVVYIGLVKVISVLQRLWWPGRAYAFVAILGGLAVSLGLAAVRQRWLQLGVALLVMGAWGGALRGQKLAPFPHWDAAIPAGYQCLISRDDGAHGDEPGDAGAIIELPFAWTQAHLYYQTAHGRPILGGMIENNPVFTPAELVSLRQDNSFLARVIAVSRSEPDPPPATEDDKRAVAALGYRYVVLQKDAFVVARDDRTMMDNAIKTRLRRMSAALADDLGRPVYDDARITIFAPWGAVSPCAIEPPPPDRRAVGRPDARSSDLVQWDPKRQRIHWLWAQDDGPSSDEDPRDVLWGTTDEEGAVSKP